jgi:hypothetical protein
VALDPAERERALAVCGASAAAFDAFCAGVRKRFELVGALY